jgi:peptide deformylase
VPVTSIDGRLQRLIDDMIGTMYSAPGVGIPASQAGELKRVIVLDPVGGHGPGTPPAPIDHEIITARGAVQEEGCPCNPEPMAESPRHHIFISTLAFPFRPCSHSLNFASAF